MFRALLAFAFAWSASSEIIEVTADGFVGDVPSAVKVNAKCVDQHKDCSFWAGIGECDKNPRYMLPNCPVSCDSCDYEGLGESIAKKAAANMAEDEAQDETGVECAEGDSFCKAAKIKARVPKGSNAQGAARKVDATKCEDRHTTCPRWKRSGECEINPGWMIVNCPQSCDACHLLNPKVRCDRAHLNISDTPAFAPGAMGEMFASIQERFGERYGVTVHSTDPWVVTFDNFVTHEEADALIAQQTKFERSTDSGKQNEFGETGRVLSQARTSSNSWCGRDCEKHPMVSSLLGRIEEVVGIQRTNYESFQVLRYDIGQYYNTHHDYGAQDKAKACGPRILTFFLYLSDVEEGGETAFPLLDIAVKPKKGKALLWPSTLDHDPLEVDRRTVHQAKPVIKGRKFAANSWIHSHNFVHPNLWGCTGTFDEI